jgi:CheY-like chemotaxis protein
LKGPVGNFATIFENYKQNEIPVDLYEHLKEASKNTYSLLQDLLTWARHKKGQIEYHTHDFLVSEIIERVISENSLNSRNKNINLVSNFCCSELYIFADMSTIHTILRNLVSNAIKFTPDGGIIEIDCECKKDFVYISVKDSGVGIPEDKLSRLFKVGERNISSPGTNNETGTGVGLLLCKEFAIGNGGDIFVESIVNKGSKFWITVPIGKKPILPSYEENIDYSKMRALVVEDNHLNMETTTMELAKLGINYEIAEDGDKAVELGTEKPYNIIFMDISLPKRNGISANKAIRKVYRDSRIAALTSFDKAEILEKDDSVIFDAYLKKPLDREELLECMNFIAIKKELD